VGSDGLIQTAVTNLLLRSEEFDNASWVKLNSTITANAITAPNGTLTADKLIADNGTTLNGGDSAGSVSQSVAGTSAIPYVYSFYAKAAEISSVRVRETVTTGARAIINLSTGAVSYESGSSSSFTVSAVNVGDGWWRIALFRTPATTLNFVIKPGSTTGDGTSGIYLWGAQLEQSSTVGEYIPTTSTINSAPRFDHNPTTGESLGLLVEESRTNSIRNNTMVGAVAGTPGTLPTNWFIGGAGVGTLTQQVVGVGSAGSLSYIDIRYSGTTSTTEFKIITEANAQIAAASGQTWTGSVYTSVVSGSTANLTGVNLAVIERNSSGVFLTETSVAANTSSTLTRTTATRTFNQATTAYCNSCVQLTFNSGVAIDITLRIGLPQLEQGAFATSVIPTTTATVTRSADVASISGSNFSGWYNISETTIRVEGQLVGGAASTFPYITGISSATPNNDVIGVAWSANNSLMRGALVSGGSGSADISSGPAKSSGSKYATAFAGSNVSAQFASDGVLGIEDTSTVIPTVDRLLIGQPMRFQPHANTTIRRLTYWPTRLPNSTLQSITQ
jgi:hypothetical protein